MERFVTQCPDNEPKTYRATYIVGGVKRVYLLCNKHAEMEAFKEGLVKLEPISSEISEAAQGVESRPRTPA